MADCSRRPARAESAIVGGGAPHAAARPEAAVPSFQNRVAGALMLRPAVFEDVEHDPASMAQATAVVLLASVSSGLAFVSAGGLTVVLLSAVWALVWWSLFAGLLWIAGTKVIPGRQTEADVGQLLRTIGFAQAPRLFACAGAAPIVGWPIGLAVFAWSVAATVVAVRQALDYESTARAAAAVALAVVVAFVLTAAAALLTGLRTVVVS
jgi:hypothetical protein